MVASVAVTGRTTSTSAMAGAGLKKWMPQTRSGRPVAMAISTTGRVEVLVARIAPGLQMLSSSAKRAFLTARSSTTDSMHQVGVDQVAQVGGGRDPGGDGVGLVLGPLPLLHLLGQRGGQTGQHGVGGVDAAGCAGHRVPGGGGHLGDSRRP